MASRLLGSWNCLLPSLFIMQYWGAHLGPVHTDRPSSGSLQLWFNSEVHIQSPISTLTKCSPVSGAWHCCSTIATSISRTLGALGFEPEALCVISKYFAAGSADPISRTFHFPKLKFFTCLITPGTEDEGTLQGVCSGVHFIPLSIVFPRFIHGTALPGFSSFLRLNRIALRA